jgi:hypothetical protein
MKKFNVIVKKKFLDGETGLFRNIGDKMTITEKRYLEIIRKGDNFIEIVKGEAPKVAPKEEIKK